jgi:glyoxylase-like metal-dependent hydrolase (beta-lactamase superfamily II)
MAASPRTLALGAATVTVVNVGDSLWPLGEQLAVPEHAWRPRYAAAFERPLLFPSQCVHIRLPAASVLVDASVYEFPPDSPQRPPAYTSPPDLSAQLVAVGVQLEDVTHLVLTHLHSDHYNGTTIARDGEYHPRFPNASCFVGRADWEQPEMQQALADPACLEHRTLDVLRQSGQVELVEANAELVPGVRLIAAPGESPGHQLVRVHSGNQTLYCLGDLYHHPVEVEQPTWMSPWCDPAANFASRQTLARAALAERALLIAAHIASVGRLAPTPTGVAWVPVW